MFYFRRLLRCRSQRFWQVDPRHGTIHELLNTFKTTRISSVNKSNGGTSTFGTSRPTDTVYIILRIWWNIEIDHQIDAHHIDAPRQYIRPNQYRKLSIFKAQ